MPSWCGKFGISRDLEVARQVNLIGALRGELEEQQAIALNDASWKEIGEHLRWWEVAWY
jgi:hypothetical protein